MDEVIRQCLDGHPWAWDAFVSRYGPLIFAAVSRTLRTHTSSFDRQTAEDMAQNVFLKLIDKDFRLLRAHDPSRSSLRTWLTIITRSTTIDFLRRKRLPTIALDQAPPLSVSSEDSPEPAGATENLPVGLLSPRQRLVLHLLFDREMSPEDVARLLGISPQTVRSSKHKAIQRLREHLLPGDSP